MAAGYKFTCDTCGFSIEIWDDGNPYIEYPAGERHYFYHPGEESAVREIAARILGHSPTRGECDDVLKRYAGNASDHVCRRCGEVSKIDHQKDLIRCGACGCADVEETFLLGEKTCLKCHGRFSKGECCGVS
jgi:hypothetical protein